MWSKSEEWFIHCLLSVFIEVEMMLVQFSYNLLRAIGPGLTVVLTASQPGLLSSSGLGTGDHSSPSFRHCQQPASLQHSLQVSQGVSSKLLHSGVWTLYLSLHHINIKNDILHVTLKETFSFWGQKNFFLESGYNFFYWSYGLKSWCVQELMVWRTFS